MKRAGYKTILIALARLKREYIRGRASMDAYELARMLLDDIGAPRESHAVVDAIRGCSDDRCIASIINALESAARRRKRIRVETRVRVVG